MKLLLSVLILASAALAQAAPTTRNVLLSWTASTSAGVQGYQVYRVSTAGVSTGVPINSAIITGTSYTDTTAVIGQTYVYGVTAVGVACSPTTPVTTVCGQSAPATATTNVPAQPAVSVTVTIAVP